jgi:hypothetical protein
MYSVICSICRHGLAFLSDFLMRPNRYEVTLKFVGEGENVARCYTGPPKAPTFNLVANVWVNFVGVWVYPPLIAFTYATPAQFQLGERVYGFPGFGSRGFILLPKATDVHFARGLGGLDYIEIPAGSGRVYLVNDVDDVGKGFVNEYRQVDCSKVPPFPVPWP